MAYYIKSQHSHLNGLSGSQNIIGTNIFNGDQNFQNKLRKLKYYQDQYIFKVLSENSGNQNITRTNIFKGGQTFQKYWSGGLKFLVKKSVQRPKFLGPIEFQ